MRNNQLFIFKMDNMSYEKNVSHEGTSSPQHPSVPDLDGYIYKMKSKQSIFGSWVKRYFKINRVTECLEYYNSKPNSSDIKPSGSIQLQRLNSVRKFDGNCLQVSISCDFSFKYISC